jgi:hypothetical protein
LSASPQKKGKAHGRGKNRKREKLLTKACREKEIGILSLFPSLKEKFLYFSLFPLFPPPDRQPQKPVSF